MRSFFPAFFAVCLFAFTIAAQPTPPAAQANLLKELLELPAPPPFDEKWSPALQVKPAERAPEFYDKDKMPPDNAPLEDLVEYWARQNRTFSPLRHKIKPSARVVERILEFCEEKPGFIAAFLNILPRSPETAETVKRLFDKLSTGEDADRFEYVIGQTRRWLFYNSTYFVDELVKDAEKVRDKDEYVTNQAELLALARVDWDKALPILERLAGDKTQPVAATLAKWAYYARAVEIDDSGDITKYRRQLQDIVEDRAMSPGARDLAFDALVSEKEWDGRDDWYVTLLADETLFDLKVNGRSYTGLTTLILYSPPEKYVKMMAALVESKNPSVRRAAIKNLLSALNNGSVEAARALLPWASNPGWAGDLREGRGALITALGKFDIPESVPALINILSNEEEHRHAAAEALAKYKDARAVPALRTALAGEKNSYRRQVFIKALDECGGLPDDEKMSALELYATKTSTAQGARDFNEKFYRQETEDGENSADLMPLRLSIGHYVSEQTEPSDGLVVRAVERLKILRKSKPAVADALSYIMEKWRGRLIFIEKLRQLRAGEADLDMILAVLAQRREIVEKIPSEVFALRTAAGIARGIAPCLADDSADLLSVLRQKDADAKIAMLGCARLFRARLPVAEIGALLKSENRTLALAAERYLESEDGVEARTLVLANRPGEALILGARLAFVTDPEKMNYSEPLRQIFESVTGRGFYGANFAALKKNEDALREEIKSNPDLLAVYGILANKPTGQQVIRVFKDRIVFTSNEDAARYRERNLSAKEYEDFYRLLLDEKIDQTVPYIGYCGDCEGFEFVMFGKNGGRRVFTTMPNSAESPLKKLFERFAEFNGGALKLRYRLADKIKGLEVLLADEKLAARAVWKNGADLRVLVEDRKKEEEIQKDLAAQLEAENKIEYEEEDYARYQRIRVSQEKRRREAKYAHFFWYGFENGSLGAISSQPVEVPFLYDETQFPETPGYDNTPRAWQTRAGAYEIKASHGEESGLYKVSRAQPPVRFIEGNYDFPITTADGKWVVASKVNNDWQEPKTIVRINLETGKEFPVNVPPADSFRALTFIASQNKILLYRARGNKYYGYRQNEADESEAEEKPAPVSEKDDKNPSPPTPEYYLLDAATGAVQLVKGEFRPLEELSYRPLQPAGAPDVFWAAVYDKKTKETAIGRYQTKTFTFETILKMPDIKLGSMDIWVVEKEAKVYFVYEGHLLSAPLQNQQK